MSASEPTVDREATAATVISSMAVGYIALDRDWRITLVNAAAAATLGGSVDALVGQDVWRRFPDVRELEAGQVCESVMATRRAASLETWWPDLGVLYELRVQPTEDGIACYFLDVTARRSAERRAAQAADRMRLLADVTESLGSSLDVTDNVARLARLVVPDLGAWSIVTIADQDGNLVDERTWHVDPARREDVRRYARARLPALVGTLAAETIAAHRPLALMSDAHRLIRERLVDPHARACLDVLAPEAGAVLPMTAHGRTVGVLCVYSDVPWTEHQFEMAKDVAARAALSLDNSLAYARAGAARAEAEATGARLSLLSQVSEALASTIEADDAMDRLARLVVPRLGDWSLVTIVDDDLGLRDVAVGHRDPSRLGEVAAYAARRQSLMTPETPLAVALRTGEPFVVETADEVHIRSLQPDPGMAQLRQGLDPHGVAVIPLTAAGRTFGALTLVTTRKRGRHTPDELSAALEVAQRAGPVLAGAQTAQRARRLAESVQRSMLTVSRPRPGLEISVRYRPAQVDNEVGGDWYDHFALPTGSTVVTIGDVMGHDTAAIAAMAQLRTFMRAAAWAGGQSPAGVLNATDSASRTLGPAMFATAVTGELAPPGPDGSVGLRWSNAGHLPPLLIEADGTAHYLRPPTVDVPLGVIPDAVRRDHSATMRPGSTLLLFTDGLVERRERDLDDGLERLRLVLRPMGGHALDRVLDQVLVEMSDAEPHLDDIAVLAVRICAQPDM